MILIKKWPKVKQNRHFYQYLLIKTINVLGSPISQKRKIRHKENFASKSFCGKKEYVHRSSDKHVGRVIILPEKINSEYILVEYEDTELEVSKYYELILKSSYGEDYMIPRKYDDFENLGHEITRKR